MLVTSSLLTHRGALYLALQGTGIEQRAVRRAVVAAGVFQGMLLDIKPIVGPFHRYLP